MFGHLVTYALFSIGALGSVACRLEFNGKDVGSEDQPQNLNNAHPVAAAVASAWCPVVNP